MEELTDEHWTAEAARLSEEVSEEEKRWVQHGFNQGMLQINAYLMQMKVNTLVALVKELGISEARLEAVFKECVLAQLKQDREMLVKAKIAAQRPGIALPNPGLLGPNGQPFKL